MPRLGRLIAQRSGLVTAQWLRNLVAEGRNIPPTFQIYWNEVRPVGNANRDWVDVRLNGEYVYTQTGGSGGRIYVSPNNSISWFTIWDNNITSGGVLRGHADGDLVFFTRTNHTTEAHISQNFGEDWDVRTLPTSNSGSGKSFVGGNIIHYGGGSSNNHLYRSTNYGVNWQSLSDMVSGVASRNGLNLVGASSSNLPIRIGVVVSIIISPDIGKFFTPSFISDSANTILVWGDNKLYLTLNRGLNWNDVSPTTGYNYPISTCSESGDIIFTTYNGRLYISRDFGNTYEETQPIGDTSSSWQTLALDQSGETLYVGNNQRLYKGASFYG